MPSSLIFVGLVVVWLLILVPAVARHRQEVARPSTASLSGRVLVRVPRRRRTEEVDVHETDENEAAPQTPRTTTAEPAGAATEAAAQGAVGVETRIPAAREGDHYASRPAEPDQDPDDEFYDVYDEDEPVDDLHPDDEDLALVEEDRDWERPAPRYRPGRGGFDPEAAAVAARARYAFRQRVVLTLIVVALGTGLVAGFLQPGMWWVHAAVDVCLVGYLVYLRQQVRMEENIRQRRAARMAGTRRPSAAEGAELDEWARRGREATRPSAPAASEDHDSSDDYGYGYDEADEADVDDDRPADEEDGPALPRMSPAPPPPLPAGTTIVDGDFDDVDLQEVDAGRRSDHRRAAG